MKKALGVVMRWGGKKLEAGIVEWRGVNGGKTIVKCPWHRFSTDLIS